MLQTNLYINIWVMSDMEYQEMFDKVCAINNRQYFSEPIIAEQYGFGFAGNALVLRSDILSTQLREMLEEFNLVFVDAKKGLVISD